MTYVYISAASSLRGSSRSSTLGKSGGGGGGGGGKSAMKVLVDSIRSETPRPKSPHMNNEEPIELAHFPAAKPPPPGEKSKIERDDFPAPPYPYSDPGSSSSRYIGERKNVVSNGSFLFSERRKRWSDSYKEVSISDGEDEVDKAATKKTENVGDEKLKVLLCLLLLNEFLLCRVDRYSNEILIVAERREGVE